VRTGFGRELPPLVRLAWPVALADLAWVSGGLIDNAMAGRVSAEAIGGIAVGGALFWPVAFFGVDVLLGLDFPVAHAVGAGNTREAHRFLVQGFYLSAGLALILTLVIRAATPLLATWGIRDEIRAQAVPFLDATTWSLLPLLLSVTLRRYLQARGLVRPVMVALVSSRLVHAAVDWTLIFGHLGAPALGARGAGWALCASSSYLVLTLLTYTLLLDHRHPTGLRAVSLRPDVERLLRLLRLGVPAAGRALLEIGAVSAVTALAGRLDAVSLAAHQIALNSVGTTFMMSLGISSAGAVRVGQALGRGDSTAAGRAGWAALLLGGGFMLAAGLGFATAPRAIMRVFTPEASVIAIGASLLLLGALFQVADGLQIVATGVLRGTGDTRTPVISNLVAYWLVGIPLGYVLCFWRGWGVLGLWMGLTAGILVVAVLLLWIWSRRVQVLGGQDEASASARRAAASPA
jgi:MATE family, multidrug efflux pump